MLKHHWALPWIRKNGNSRGESLDWGCGKRFSKIKGRLNTLLLQNTNAKDQVPKKRRTKLHSWSETSEISYVQDLWAAPHIPPKQLPRECCSCWSQEETLDLKWLNTGIWQSQLPLPDHIPHFFSAQHQIKPGKYGQTSENGKLHCTAICAAQTFSRAKWQTRKGSMSQMYLWPLWDLLSKTEMQLLENIPILTSNGAH